MTNLLYKLKRKWNYLSTPCQLLGNGPAGREKVSLVLYFDYEREFGNIEAKHSAQAGFDFIISALNQNAIKATWNCVGLIMDRYPETIKQLKDYGQEIASHTHRHIDPLKVKANVVKEDLALTKQVFLKQFSIHLEGFHPPEDGWSRSLIGDLSELGFTYAILKKMNNSSWHTALCHDPLSVMNKKKRILRIPSICDDWLFMEGKSAEHVLSYWMFCLDSVKKGSAIAMGFHPWVLGKDENRLQVFAKLLAEIKSRNDIELFTGCDIISWYHKDILNKNDSE